MDKVMEKLKKLSLPAVILIASIILGGFYFASQISKQRSIERQQQIKIEQEKQDQLVKELKEQRAKEEAEQALNACLSNAHTTYVNFWDSECEGLDREKDCRLPMYLVERLDASEEKDKTECFKKYPQK